MKRAAISIHRKDGLSPLQVEGYAADVCGHPAVIHRTLLASDPVKFSDKAWSISDPRTGMVIRHGMDNEKRDRLVERANRFVEERGGRSEGIDPLSGDVLALVVEDEKAAYLVMDSRSGRPVSWHGDLRDANGVAVYLNSEYPDGFAPATDTLIFEVMCRRIEGRPPQCIEMWWLFHQLDVVCPAHVPTGPGWDHIHEEVVRREAG